MISGYACHPILSGIHRETHPHPMIGSPILRKGQMSGQLSGRGRAAIFALIIIGSEPAVDLVDRSIIRSLTIT